MRSAITLASASVLVLWVSIAAAQNNLGELLDAGAKKLSAEEFKEEVVQRVIVGPAPAGGTIEVMYARTGVIDGRGAGVPGSNVLSSISGEWRTDDNGRVCTSMQIGVNPGIMLPPRCQFWYKNEGQYFFTDSDSDRHARVFRRALKQ